MSMTSSTLFHFITACNQHINLSPLLKDFASEQFRLSLINFIALKSLRSLRNASHKTSQAHFFQRRQVKFTDRHEISFCRERLPQADKTTYKTSLKTVSLVMVTTHSKRKKEKKIPDFFSNSPENNFQVVNISQSVKLFPREVWGEMSSFLSGSFKVQVAALWTSWNFEVVWNSIDKDFKYQLRAIISSPGQKKSSVPKTSFNHVHKICV